MVGLPNFLSITTLRPFGPMVALTAAAMMLTPRSRAARPSSLNRICFGICFSSRSCDGMDRPSGPGRVGGVRLRLLDDREHVLFLHDQVLLVVDLHLGARVLAEEDAVVGLHVQRDLLAVLRYLPVAHRDDLALLGLLLRGVGNDDAALLGVLLFLALDEDPVMQRTNLHGYSASRLSDVGLRGRSRSAGSSAFPHRAGPHLLAGQHQELDTLVGNSPIGFLLTGHGRPTLLFYIVTPLPSICVFHCFELVVFTRVLCKPDDTHRGQALDDSIFPCQGSHAPSRTPCHPSAPSEADNHRDHSRGHTRPEDDRLRRSGFTPPLSNSASAYSVPLFSSSVCTVPTSLGTRVHGHLGQPPAIFQFPSGSQLYPRLNVEVILMDNALLIECEDIVLRCADLDELRHG